jgi:hypothetical protein
LRDAFGDDRSSEIDCFEEDDAPVASGSGSTPTPSPSPLTPQDDMSGSGYLALALTDPEELEAQANVLRSDAVAAGWRERWVLPNAKGKSKERGTPTLRRRETNVTPAGRHFPISGHGHLRLTDAPSSVPTKRAAGSKARPLQSRRSLAFLDSGVRPKLATAKGRASDTGMIRGNEDEEDDDAVARAQIRLAQYRFVDVSPIFLTY